MNEPYRCVVADPPWFERGSGKIKRGADRHYPLMSTDDIISVIRNAFEENPVAADAHLWLWSTNNFLPDALHVMDALGFRYITNLAWVKRSFGLGYYLRGQHELCLFGSRGQAAVREHRDTPSVLICESGEHSEKPADLFRVFERVSPPPYLELFARATRQGWTTLGNDVQPSLL